MLKYLKLDQLKRLSQSQGLRQSVLVTSGNGSSMGISALALIVISRFLGPEKFGVFSVGFAILLMLNRISDIGLSYTIQKYAAKSHDHKEINRIFSYATRYKLFAVLLTSFIGLLVFLPLSKFLSFSNPSIILLAFLLSSVSVAFEHIQAMLQSLHRFSQSVVINVLQSIIKLIGAIALFITSLSQPILAFILYMTAPAIPIIFLFRKIFPSWVKLRLSVESVELNKSLKVMARHSAVSYISAGIIDNIDILFVERYLDPFETGLLGGVSRIAMLFSLLAFSLGTVLNPRVARYKEKKDVKSFFIKAIGILFLSIIGFLVLAPFSKWLIIFSIGGEYLAGVGILQILLAASFLTVAVIPFMALFFSFDFPWYFSLSGILQLGIIIAGNLLFVPSFGLAAAAWTRLVSRLVLLVFTLTLALYAYQKKFTTN